TAKMAVLRCARRYGDFGPQSLRPSCAMKISRHTCAAQKFREKSSRNAARICFPELGGAKNRGHAPSGTCNWELVNWFGVTNRKEFGKWMGFMTEENRNSRFVNRESRRRTAEIEGKAAMDSGERARAASEFQSTSRCNDSTM